MYVSIVLRKHGLNVMVQTKCNPLLRGLGENQIRQCHASRNGLQTMILQVWVGEKYSLIVHPIFTDRGKVTWPWPACQEYRCSM